MNRQFIIRAFPDTRKDRLITSVLLVIAGFVAALGFWAGVAKIPEVAKTRGEAIPRGGDVQVIQSLSGGKVMQVFVQEGDVVEQGQLIASLDQSISESDISKLDVKRSDLMMQIERLRALEKNRKPNFGAEGEQYPGMAEQQHSLYASQKGLLDSRLSVIDDKIGTKNSEITSLGKQIVLTEEQVVNIEKEVAMFRKAADSGLGSKRELLEKQERESDLKSDLEALRGRLASGRNELVTLKEQRKTEELTIRTEFRTKRAEVVELLNELEQELVQAHSAMGQNALIAPAAGIIKSLPNTRAGAVIQPGGVVAELVPSDQPLNVEVRVSPRDIGFIAVGQKVLIKVDAYDYSRFGAIKGSVIRVSPATFKDEATGQPYFKATIQPESEFVGDAAKGRRIKVGMTAEADITTGEKTIFQYLLKPVYTTVDTALTER
jgi:HlyD family secretion protein/adhesin transport system membrane fusion protein